jgi:hypothetical protein
MNKPTRPSHGAVAGYLGLLFGVLALTGGSSYAAQLLDGKQLRSGSVKTPKLAMGSVTAAKLHKNAVTTVKLNKNSVTAIKLAKNAVTTRSIKNRSITAAKLAPNSVTPALLGASAVTSEKIADSSVLASKLGNGSITTSKIADGAVTGAKVHLQVVTASTTVAAGSTNSATATCPAGMRAFGGGVKLDDATVTINTGVRQSQPVVDANGDPVGWTGIAISLAVATPFHVYAVCG